MKIEVGTPLFICRRGFIRNKVEIIREFIIKVDGDWVHIGYANHPKAFSSSNKIDTVKWIYSSTPEEAVKKFKRRLGGEIDTIEIGIHIKRDEQKKLAALRDTITVEKCKLVEQEYDPLDDLF